MELKRTKGIMHRDEDRQLYIFYTVAKDLLIDFPKQAFFSDFLKLEYCINTTLALFNTTTKQGNKVLCNLNNFIAKRKQELLSVWATDIIQGFEILQNSATKHDVDVMNFKFATNHHQHVMDVVQYAGIYPTAIDAFIATVRATAAVAGSMPGMSAIKSSLANLQKKGDGSIDAAAIKTLFTTAVANKQTLLNRARNIVGYFAEIGTAGVTQQQLVELQNLVSSRDAAIFPQILTAVTALDGAQDGEQSRMFFEQVKHAVVAADAAQVQYFDDVPANVEGVRQALLRVIRDKLALQQSPKPPPSPIVSAQTTTPTVAIDTNTSTSTKKSMLLNYSDRLVKVSKKKHIPENLQVKYHVTAEDVIKPEDFIGLRTKVAARVKKYNPSEGIPLSFGQDKRSIQIASARNVYSATEIIAVTNNAFQMRSNNKEMFSVNLQSPQSIVVAYNDTTSKSVVAGAEAVKDSVALLQVKGKKVKDLVIDDYEAKPMDGLAIFCSLACQSTPVVFGGDYMKMPRPENKGYYEVALFLQKIWDLGNKEALMRLVDPDNTSLQDMYRHATALCTPTRNSEAIVAQLAIKFNLPVQHDSLLPPTSA